MLDNQVLDEGMEILEGRFKVIKRLGSGSFGEIYQGKHYKILKHYNTLIYNIVQKIKDGEMFAAKIVSKFKLNYIEQLHKNLSVINYVIAIC